jgi:hypothetical protein
MIIDGESLGRAARLCASLRATMSSSGPVTLAAAPAPMPEALARRARAARPVSPARIERGQLWVAAPADPAEGARTLVLLLRVEGARCEALCAHEEPWIARDRDVILRGDASPTGQCLAVILEPTRTFARARLLHFVGSVSTAAWTTLRAVLARSVSERLDAPARPVDRGALPGGGRCARSVLRRSLAVAGGPLEWLSGAPCEDPDDPREEVHALLAEATGWMLESRASTAEPSTELEHLPPSTLRARLEGLLAVASRIPPPTEAGAPAPRTSVGGGPVVGALVGALRGPEDPSAAGVRFEVPVGPGCVAHVRVYSERAAFVASAHIHGMTDGQQAALTLRNAGTSEVASAADRGGVVLPIRLPARVSDPVELSVSVGDAVVRLAF